MNNKDVKKMVKYAEERGFVIVRQKKHIIMRRRTQQLVLSQTASCHRTMKNIRADIDRIVKEEP